MRKDDVVALFVGQSWWGGSAHSGEPARQLTHEDFVLAPGDALWLPSGTLHAVLGTPRYGTAMLQAV